MPDMQRLVYASRATFVPSQRGLGIELEVARIVMQARRNNARLGVVGAIYYADGCFLQCLEGELHAVDALTSRIESDPRHADMKVLCRRPISSLSFSEWSMKLVPHAKAVRDFLARNQRKYFDPYRFDTHLTDAIVELLRKGNDADLDDRGSGNGVCQVSHQVPETELEALPSEGKEARIGFLRWLRSVRS